MCKSSWMQAASYPGLASCWRAASASPDLQVPATLQTQPTLWSGRRASPSRCGLRRHRTTELCSVTSRGRAASLTDSPQRLRPRYTAWGPTSRSQSACTNGVRCYSACGGGQRRALQDLLAPRSGARPCWYVWWWWWYGGLPDEECW